MRFFKYVLLLGLIPLTVMALQAPEQASRPTSPGPSLMKEGRFVNTGQTPHTRREAPKVMDQAEMLISRLWTGATRKSEKTEEAVSSVTPDLSFLKSNHHRPSFTWLGHATCLVQMGGQTLLTDPHFSERASPVSFMGPRRLFPSPISLKDLPHIDVVVISHSHYDHLDLPTLHALAQQSGGSPLFLVPLELKAWMHAQGLTRTEELDWWQTQTHQGVRYTLVPAHHWSTRTLWDRNKTLWGGWVVRSDDFKFYFTGDTGYSDLFPQIASLGPFDVSAIAIGSYEPRGFMKVHHINPEEAVRIHQEVGSQLSIGIHWGTFRLSSEALQQPPRDLERALEQHRLDPKTFITIPPGETLRFPRR